MGHDAWCHGLGILGVLKSVDTSVVKARLKKDWKSSTHPWLIKTKPQRQVQWLRWHSGGFVTQQSWIQIPQFLVLLRLFFLSVTNNDVRLTWKIVCGIWVWFISDYPHQKMSMEYQCCGSTLNPDGLMEYLGMRRGCFPG